ncbi:MAG: selenide, water dikinase SelD [Aquificaceae bacterium]|nr:selenide, water dikinase SelD [Aquificaceae bacterium]MCS7307965.1 selenide, water dikinase SelD [Aquificaceae bacterium]MCX8076431.1 selenide, water dikinase SelD [Aquificaceae bacterium]MDW8433238.1 selenide, water dikinase SelD [Aquificaceae bacterium]
MGPGDLEELIKGLELYRDENTLVGVGDDAGVYAYGGEVYAHTVDFITPVVNDPYLWGAISTVNSLSDIYAMGCEPINALAVVGFNNCELEVGVLKEVMKGCADKLREARVVLLGGHTVDDKEPKFGLAVTGVCKGGRYLTQAGAKVGDLVAITKPIGVGIITKAIKEGKLTERDVKHAIEYMLRLNHKASELALSFANACTDITGFGLLGHAYNIARKSSLRLVVDFSKVPVYEEALFFVKEKIYPKGAVDNLNFLKEHLQGEGLQWWQTLLLCDPVTSGGLLFTFSEDLKAEVEKKAKELGVELWVVGWVEEGYGLKVVKT